MFALAAMAEERRNVGHRLGLEKQTRECRMRQIGVRGRQHQLDVARHVDLSDAGEVIPVPPITPVPLTRPWFKGATNIRGNLFSVVDFPAFLGGAAVALTEQSRLLLVGERFLTRVEIGRVRRLGASVHVQFRFRMWKHDPEGREIETYRSEQHAIFFPPGG